MRRRREFVTALAAGSAGLLAGCIGGGDGNDSTTPTATRTPTATPAATTEPPETTTAGESPERPTPVKLAPADGDGGDRFGYAVAVDGDTALVGAFWDEDSDGAEAGSAYVFERDDDGWAQTAKLRPAGGGESSHFGGAVALDGNVALVGATGVDRAYVFRRAAESWQRTATLAVGDATRNAQFGTAVAIRDGTALVGAWRDDANGEDAGSAYAFERGDDGWVRRAKLTAEDGGSGDWLGAAVALGGDAALLGAPGDGDPNGGSKFEGAGSAYVFDRDGGDWTQAAKLAPDDGDKGDQFGVSAALADGVAMVGAFEDADPNGTNAGAVYVADRDGGSWGIRQKLGAPDGDSGDRFGQSVATTGDRAVVGAGNDADPNGAIAGSAYLFERRDAGWSHARKLVAPDGDARDQFGQSVALSEGTALIGAHRDEDPNGTDEDGFGAGAAYVFDV